MGRRNKVVVVAMVWIVNFFARALCHNTSRAAEDEHSCLQEQLAEEENLYLKNQNF